MTPQEIKQQAHKEFDKKFVKDSIMTNVRLIERQNPNEIKSFLDSLIDRTVQMTEERVAQKLKGAITLYPTFYDGISFLIPSGWSDKLEKYIISFITNKSEINK